MTRALNERSEKSITKNCRDASVNGIQRCQDRRKSNGCASVENPSIRDGSEAMRMYCGDTTVHGVAVGNTLNPSYRIRECIARRNILLLRQIEHISTTDICPAATPGDFRSASGMVKRIYTSSDAVCCGHSIPLRRRRG